MLNFSLFFHNLAHLDGKHKVSLQGPPRMLPAPYLGNNSDTFAFFKHRLNGEFLYSTYNTDMLVWNSGPDIFSTGTSRLWRMMHGHSFSVVLTVSQTNSVHHCHSCMTWYWTDSTSPREQNSSWIPNCLIISIHPYFLPSVDILVSKLDIHTFIEAVNFMVSLYNLSEKQGVLTINKNNIFHYSLSSTR